MFFLEFRRFFGVFVALLLWAAGFAMAEAPDNEAEAKSSPSPLSSLTIPATSVATDTATEQLGWVAEMAETSYRMKKTPADKYAWIYALEELTNQVCMPHLLRDLQYAGKPQDKRCLELIDKLLEISPNSPAAICARDGIQSKTCHDAYKVQSLGTIPSPQKTNADLQVEAKLSTLELSLQRTKSLASYINLNNAYSRVFDRYCRNTSLAVPPSELPRPTAEPQDAAEDATAPRPNTAVGRNPFRARPGSVTAEDFGPQKDSPPSEMVPDNPNPLAPRTLPSREPQLGKAFDELLKELKQDPNKKKKPEDDKPVVRLRVIPKLCAEYIERAAKFIPQSGLITCRIQGSFTPGCVEAVQRERQFFAVQRTKEEAANAKKQKPPIKAKNVTPRSRSTAPSAETAPGFAEF